MPDLDKRERMYLLREGHLYGFCFGVWMGYLGNPWLVLGWGVVLIVLWAWSLGHSGRRPNDGNG